MIGLNCGGIALAKNSFVKIHLWLLQPGGGCSIFLLKDSLKNFDVFLAVKMAATGEIRTYLSMCFLGFFSDRGGFLLGETFYSLCVISKH